jgi:hypothetical protein
MQMNPRHADSPLKDGAAGEAQNSAYSCPPFDRRYGWLIRASMVRLNDDLAISVGYVAGVTVRDRLAELGIATHWVTWDGRREEVVRHVDALRFMQSVRARPAREPP